MLSGEVDVDHDGVGDDPDRVVDLAVLVDRVLGAPE